MMLLDEHGAILACSARAQPSYTSSGESHTREDGVPAARWTRSTGIVTGAQGSIIGIALSCFPSEVAQAPAWSILVQQDPAETFEPLSALLGKLGAFWIGTGVFVVWLRWRLGRRIVRPLGALIQRINQMGGGEYSALLPSSSNRGSGIEEIDRLAASFDELAERLELASQAKAQYLRRVEQANADLATSEEHYRLLWDHSVDTKILVDPSV